MRFRHAILIGCSCAMHLAHGSIIVSAPETGWADAAWESPEEYRWGATARNMDPGTGDWEIGVGNDHAMSEDTVGLDWGGPGTSHSFTLDYDPLRMDRVIWTIDGESTVLQDPATLFSDMYIQLKGRPGSSQAHIGITNTTITVDGALTLIDDFAAGYGEADNLQYIRVGNFDEQLSDLDFVLEGTLLIDWTGAAPVRDEMGMHVKLTQIPEPASVIMVVMVSLSGLFIRRMFRK